MTRRNLHRVIILAGYIAGSAAVVLCVAALAIQFRIHLANEWQDHISLPLLQEPKSGDRILIVAPHADDETLGCGGLIALAKQSGARLRIVFVTNGDGYRIGVARAYKTVKVTPEKCIEFGYIRQRETLKALAHLGVSKSDLIYLGYPDRGIANLWARNWEESSPYTSHATKQNYSPYNNSLTPQAPYCGESLLRDMQAVLEKEKPTHVIIPSPYDDHSDHYATYCFVTAAIEQMRAEGSEIAKNMDISTYIVHRGDWPVPMGDKPCEYLAPPSALVKAGHSWQSLELPEEITRAKQKAIREYKTQTDIEPGFLRSFARRNEIYAGLSNKTIKWVNDRQITVDGDPDDWFGVPPVVLDPVGDKVVAGINKSGDVRAIYMCRDDSRMYIRFDCVRRISKRINYNVNLRGIGCSNTDDSYTITLKPPKKSIPGGTLWAYKNNVIELSLPLNKQHQEADMFVQVFTRMLKLRVDNTGWHSFEFEPQPGEMNAVSGHNKGS